MPKCYYCGHIGDDVTKVAHVHIGGQGDVEYPCCDNANDCIAQEENRPTLEGLDDLVGQMNTARDKMLRILYPHGKPDEMSREHWIKIGGK